MRVSLTNIRRLWHTLRYLKPKQIAYQLKYRFLNFLPGDKRGLQRAYTAELQSSQATIKQPYGFPPTTKGKLPKGNLAPLTYLGGQQFCFLNIAHSFSAGINWNHAAYGKLWTYNLNYFEYLRQPDLAYATGNRLVEAWIAAAATHRDGHEPYPSSLRIVHWLQFYRHHRGAEIPSLVVHSIYEQYRQLWQKLEFHLMGNHLLENAIALTMAALFFKDDQGLRRAEKLLSKQLVEQYCRDGGHFERSPMYHCILLWRLLDLYSWGSPAEDSGPNTKFATSGSSKKRAKYSYFEVLKDLLPRQLSWLKQMIDDQGCHPDLNDSTRGISPPAQTVIAYAHALGLTPDDKVLLNDSGYRHWQHRGADIWIDLGPLGPDYIPGHGHADNLTFNVNIAGAPILVDPGISTYEKNERRQWERSTFAHNTVTLDQKNSSDVWGGFRVGKRAKTSILAEDSAFVVAAHQGFFATKATHERAFHLEENGLLVTDKISNAEALGTARFFFAEGLTLDLRNKEVVLGQQKVQFTGAVAIRLLDYQRAKGFNNLVAAQYIAVDFYQQLKTRISW